MNKLILFFVLLLLFSCKKDSVDVTLTSISIRDYEDLIPDIIVDIDLIEDDTSDVDFDTALLFSSNVPYQTELEFDLEAGEDYKIIFYNAFTESESFPIYMKVDLLQFDLLSQPDTLMLVDELLGKEVFLSFEYEGE